MSIKSISDVAALPPVAVSLARCTKECPNRYPYRRAANQGENMKRAVYICNLRDGFMIKHWKCLGVANPKCPINPTNARALAQPPTQDSPNSKNDL